MPFKFNRRLYCEQLEKRRPLALTTPDLVELVSQEETYLATSPVLQRTLVAPTIAFDAQGGSAYDLRADLPGDQTLRLSSDVTNTHGTQVSRLGESFARVLVDPTSVYEVNYYMNQESWQVVIDAYDQAGTFLNRLNLGVTNDPARDLEGDWHRGFIGRPNDRGSSFIELPTQTKLIEIRYAPALTIGFVGDALDSGPQVVRWRDERSYVSSRTIDLIEADQAVLVEEGKTYTLDASVTHRGSSMGITHSVGYTAYDRDGLQIESKHVERYGSAFDTRLAADLNPGDTTIDLVNATGWSLDSSRPETRSIAWYGYSDSTGRVYADFTYTRHVASNPAYGMWDVGGITGNRINLREPWSGPRLTAGSAVRNTVAGPSLFPVVAQRQVAPIIAQSTVGGSWTNGFPDPRSFPAGTAMFRPAAELNQTLQFIGNTQLNYRVSTKSVGSVDVDRLGQTRSVTIDVLANDSVAQSSVGRLQSVSTPAYGMAQIVTNPATGSQQVRYVTSPNFIGVDRFSYTYVNAGGERFTEWVNVASLGGNVDADPALQQAINANQSNLTTSSSVDDYGGVSFIAVSGQVLTSRADNHNNLKSLMRNPSTPLSFSLTRGTLHGTLTVNADGTLTYQSESGFVGIDTFEYAASNGLRATSRIGMINVVANVDEADRRKVGNIALGLLNAEASHRRMFYPPAVPQDANAVPLLSWRVHLLPFLGYASLYNRFRLDEAWNSPNNLPLLNEMPDIFRSAGDDSLSSVTRFLTIQAGQASSPTWHFMHSNGSPRVTKISQLMHGLSNTLMVLRSGSNRAVPWTKPEDLQFDNTNPLATVGSLGEAFLPVAFADATAVLMPTNVTNSIFTSIATTAPTPGVSAVDGQTLARAWSERLTAPATHLQNYHAQQPKSLRSIGLAMHNYESATKTLPPASSVDASGNQLLSWRVHLLPYLEHGELYSRFRLNEPWNSPHNLTLLDSMPDVFRSAADLATTNTTRIRLLNGPGTLYSSQVTGSQRFSRVTDGTSNTIFAVEAGTDKAVPWTAPDTLPVTSDILASLGQLPDGRLSAIMLDGAIVSLPLDIPNATLYALATFATGELVSNPAVPNEYQDFRSVSSVTNGLKQIMLAVHNFESGMKRLPMNYWGANQFTKATATPTLSWRVAILPYIDQVPLYNAFRLNEPWDSAHNLALIQYMPAVFRSMGDAPNSTTTRMQMFSGAKTVLQPDFKTLRLADITDGSSNTLGVVEAGIDKAVPWTKPSDLDGDLTDLWQALGLVGQSFVAGMMDGSVQTISKEYNRYLHPLVERNDGNVISTRNHTNTLVIREGELVALVLPSDNFALDPQSFLQMSSSRVTVNNFSGTAMQLTFRAIPNDLPDGPRAVRLVADGRAIDIVVLDDDALSLRVDQAVISESGGQATFTVTRPTPDATQPLTVRLTSSQPLRLPVPDTIVIPAGNASITFTATAIDDSMVANTELVRVTAVTPGSAESSTLVKLADDDGLILTFASSSISELGGITTATLKRVGSTSQPLAVNLTSLMPTKVAIPAQVIIPVGQSSIDFQITAIDNQLYDGSTRIRILAQSADDSIARGDIEVTDFEAIELNLSKVKASEANEPVMLTVRRTADSQGKPVIVKLRTDRSDKMELPESIVIPANLAEVNVELRTIDNRILDGLTHVNISAIGDSSGDEYTAGQVTLNVTDQESLTLTLSSMRISENNATSRAKLTRGNVDIAHAITVTLKNSRPELVAVPSSVTIPAGIDYVEFDVRTIDNDQLTAVQQVTIDAIQPAYLPESLTFEVIDHEPLHLTVNKIDGAEGSTLIATVSRANSNLDQMAVVSLTSSDSSEIGIPSSVIIPVNERSITLAIALLPDRILDGTQTSEIRAEASGYIAAATEIVVRDHETIHVALEQNQNITESDGSIMARLTRSDVDSNFPLLVLATSSDVRVANVAEVPLRIEAHQSSITFPITVLDDLIIESTQNVRINFSVKDPAFDDYALDLLVIDDETPWHNATDPLDVNQDQVITPLDALLVINSLNSLGSRPTSDMPNLVDGQSLLIDTNEDQFLSAIDALLIINHLNQPSAEASTQASAQPITQASAEGEFDVWWNSASGFADLELWQAQRRKK